ncbi:MAG: HlyD family secretion protein [Burkholderiales bacterium]
MTVRGTGRRLLRFVLLIIVPLVAIGIGLVIYARGGRYAETDNAYVKAKVIAISAEVAGRVLEVAVRDNQPVQAGAPLFRVDTAPMEVAMLRAEAQMAVVRTEVESLRGEYRVALAEVAEAEEQIGYLRRQLERQERLKERGMSREDQFDEARNNLDTAQRRVVSSRERAARVLAALGGDPKIPVERHPRYLEARAAREEAKLDLERAIVRAPAGGVVSNMRLQPGEHVQRGMPVFSLVEGGAPWIEANYKETQLSYMREGQPATVEADAYPGVRWRARVSAIAPATGAEFAVLPPQNATGNWVKVVQRVPVILDIEKAGGQPPLRAGMTVTVSVDTGHERELPGFLRALLRPALADRR